VKLAISNIAWPAEQDEAVAARLSALQVTGIEIAPTKIWQSPLQATSAQIDSYRRFWESRGIAIVAAQSLLFGQPQLTLFDDPATRRAALDYLRQIVPICAQLGAHALVFGSPRNRQVGSRDKAEVWQIAIDFFGELSEVALTAGTVIGMEANPPEYGTDFVNHTSQAIDLVRAVNHPGFRLHLDCGCMTLAGDSLSLIAESMPLVRHFHVSEPGLVPIGSGAVNHQEFARQLQEHAYDKWISIEMREPQPFSLEAVSAPIEYTSRIYLNRSPN
jgi:D-psicose/D-tagatose/L-ribulose 3-epimerase